MPTLRLEVGDSIPQDARRSLLEAAATAAADTLGADLAHCNGRVVGVPTVQRLVPTDRTESFMLVEITLYAGRSRRLKARLHRAVAQALQDRGVQGSDVMIVLREVGADDQSFRNGDLPRWADTGDDRLPPVHQGQDGRLGQ